MADSAVYSEGLIEFPPRPGTLTLPKDYEADAVRKWPLVIYLHGGSG
jgi:hypothetical protein